MLWMRALWPSQLPEQRPRPPRAVALAVWGLWNGVVYFCHLSFPVHALNPILHNSPL